LVPGSDHLAEPVAWLSNEIVEIFAAGTVGLYELMWYLNGDDFVLTESEKRHVATAVAYEFVRSGYATLNLLKWPTDGVIAGPLEITSVVDATNFPSECDEHYLALVPN
jgi:hypothetical protein